MTDRDDVLDNWQAQLRAMDDGDTESLTACFTPVPCSCT